MRITNGNEKQLGAEAGKNRPTDMINGELINSLGHLVGEKRCGARYDIETVCVESGLVRFDVCGMIDLGDFIDFAYIIGDDGIKRDVEDFYLD